MNRQRTLLIALLLAGGLCVLPGAAWAQFGRIGDIMKKTEAFKPISTEQEVAMGREVAAKMVAYFKVFENEKAAAYVRKVGQALAAQSERQDVTCHFELLDTDTVNAFAAPGGYIFVTRGLLETIKTESELAGVLGHEVGHVAGKHIVNQIQTGKMVQSGLKEAGSLTPGSRFLDDLAKDILTRLIDRGLDHKDEYDADQRGINYAYAAGYRPDGLKSFLATLQPIVAQSAANTSWLARTHPPIPERIQRLEQTVAQKKMQTEGRPDNFERYQVTMKAAAQQ